MAETWQNWARTVAATPSSVANPASVDELCGVVSRSTGPVRAVGSGHSFTAVAATSGLQLRLDRLAGLVGVDHSRRTATLLAGTTLAEANRLLAAEGMAFGNLGDIDAQTVAGAVSTGTHGTGRKLTGLAGMLVAVELVTAAGELRRIDGPALDAVRVSLGALGVLATLTFAVEPAFLLHAVERPAGLDETLESFEAWTTEHDHTEFYWFPHTRRVLTKTNDRVEGPPRPLQRARAWFDDEFMSNTVYERANRVLTRRPRLTPWVNQLSARALTAREYVDASHRVFCSPRRVRFREMEYAIPVAALPAVLSGAQAWLDRTGDHVAFPVEVRVAAGDTAWLSTAHGGERAYVAFHQYVRRDHRGWFDAVEALIADVGGRPHWGKLHTLDADRLRELYPRFGEFSALRDRLDPERRFGNPHLERVLGR